MSRRVVYLAVSALVLLSLGGCALNIFNFQRREPWRAQAENACMASRPFRGDDYIERVRSITENRVCGLEQPLIVAALIDGQVRITPRSTIDCPMVATLEAWLTNAVMPAAMARLGSPVVGLRQMGGYNCRPVQNRAGAELSEHAFGNAIDIAAFELADGRVVSVLQDWYAGTPAERDFLRDVHYTSCQYFTTVLGPGYENHEDHFHLDLARHNEAGTTRYCRPTPVMPAPAVPTFLPLLVDAGTGNFTPLAYAPGDPAALSPANAAILPTDIGTLIERLTE
ncbi:MAG: extensin-like domain-containing protein [Bauldia sp.]